MYYRCEEVLVMLIASLVLNIILLGIMGYLGYLYYPRLSQKVRDFLWNEIRTVQATRSNPICPFCKQEFIGPVRRSASGHWCCAQCLASVFNNQ